MNGTRLSIIVLFILFLSLIGYLMYDRSLAPKLAYIELSKVFVEFQMKKELEVKLKVVREKRQSLMDSLKFELQILSKQIEEQKGKDKDRIAVFSVKRDAYFEKQKHFEEDDANTAKMFDDQIFTQLNQYVKDYGNKNGYLIILGAEGSGALMYAKESINITEEIKKYVNERYRGN
jgi:outer membrane protein